MTKIEQVYGPDDPEFAQAVAEVSDEDAIEHFNDIFFGPDEVDGRCVECWAADRLGLWEKYDGEPLATILEAPNEQ